MPENLGLTMNLKTKYFVIESPKKNNWVFEKHLRLNKKRALYITRVK